MLEFLCKHLDLIESVLIKYTKYRTEGGLPVLKIGDLSAIIQYSP